jgi:F0F1-type ATP synthase delta subunit
MKPFAKRMARELIALCAELPAEKWSEACDAIVSLTLKYGSSRDLRALPRAVSAQLRKNALLAEVQVATPSGSLEAHRKSFEAVLEKVLKRKVVLEEAKQEDLIGGAILSYDDERYDFSLRGALQALQQQLASPTSFSSHA